MNFPSAASFVAAAAASAPAGAGQGVGPPAGWSLYVAERPPGAPPAGPRRPLAFESLLFLEPAHLALAQSAGPMLSFYLEDPAAGQSVAQLHVELGPPVAGPAAGAPGGETGQSVARSPGQAPFGAVQAAAGLPAAALHQLFDGVEAALRARGQRRLHLRAHPFCYDPAGAARLAEVLRQRLYPVVLAEQNYHLELGRDYLAHLTYNERHCVRRCQRAGFVLEQEPPLLLPQAYAFMQECRRERGQPPPSLSLARVQALFAAFPRQHLLHAVRTPAGEWAAVGVAIQVSAQVLYNFYVASLLRYNKLSPAVLLHGGLHAFGRASGLRVLDLGTSTLPTGPNASLLRFKRHLGGVAGLRLSWEKEL